jgi:flavin-dependent thymidylate synthase
MNKNKVELLGYYGSDRVIALSAWTSTNRDLCEEKIERIPKLINQLWSNGHETPFEKGIVHFLVDCDVASHIHLLKHRISSLNAESARYKELKEDKFYLPDDWSGEYSLVFWQQRLKQFSEESNSLYHKCLDELTPILGRKRAKESARFFKAYNSQITADVMFNMRSFANFIKLRKSPNAQKEIRDISSQMLSLIMDIEGNPFCYTLKTWEENGVFEIG